MTKLKSWSAWVEQSHSRVGDDKFTLEMSSHGKAFSYAWDAAVEAAASKAYGVGDEGMYAQIMELKK